MTSQLDARAVALHERIRTLADQYNNHETGIEADAVRADAEGRPAYWFTTRYHNAAVGLLAGLANLQSLSDGLRHVVDPTHPGKLASVLLAKLIPLNPAAETELRAAQSDAYWAEAPGALQAAE